MPHWIKFVGVCAFALIALLAALVLLDYMTRVVGWEIWPRIVRARRALRKLVRVRVQAARVHTRGATHLSPRLLCICIDVETDEERDRLLADPCLLDEARLELARVGYPEKAISFVAFRIESQQTVERDFGGSWLKARK